MAKTKVIVDLDDIVEKNNVFIKLKKDTANKIVSLHSYGHLSKIKYESMKASREMGIL
jgi:hypothetical protein